MTTSSATTLRVQVLLFSVLREQVGAASLPVTLTAPATGNDVLDRLSADHPVIASYRPAIRLAVNEHYVPETAPLDDGDEVALITPVSGG